MDVVLHRGDLPATVQLGNEIAIDSEAMGLKHDRDRLCLVQLTDGNGTCHLVQVAQGQTTAPNLKQVLEDPSKLKIFHFARFDVALLRHALGIHCAPIYCTKIASKLVRTYTDRHGLKELLRELLGIEVSKQEQSSDWGQDKLSEAQIGYAARDVEHLHALKHVLDRMLERENRRQLAQSCFDFMPNRVALDLAGWNDVDIFAHS